MSERTQRSDAKSSIVELKQDDELDELLTNEPSVLVDFYADWCGPCQMMEDTVETVAETGNVTVVKINIDTFQHAAARFDVRSIPTFVGFDRGEPSGRLVGMQDEEALRQLLS